MKLSRTVPNITSAAALQAVTVAVACGRDRGVAVVACVVDAGGHVVATLRADGAFIASLAIARDKAWTAAVFGCSTDQLNDGVSVRAPLRDGIARREGVVLFGGGLPLIENARVIGGIGVSGGSEDDDRACAAAACAALRLPPST